MTASNFQNINLLQLINVEANNDLIDSLVAINSLDQLILFNSL